MAYSGSYGGSSNSCRSYCNITGYYVAGFPCDGGFCCGSANVRFCCRNSTLDISNTYPEKCRCPMSSCSYLSWDVLLPCIAAAMFVLLMVTICCCQGCRSCIKFRQAFRRRCLRSNSATVSDGPVTSPANLEQGQRTTGDNIFPNLPPYEFGPPKYESLELVEAPPKYEDIMTPGQPEAHTNRAFVGDSVTHDYIATPDYSVTPDCTVTDDSHSHDTMVPGTSGPQQADNDSRTSGEGPAVTKSKVLGLLNTERPCQSLQANQLHETSLAQSPPSHELTPSAGTESSTCLLKVACQGATTPGQVIGTPADANWEIVQVVERTTSEGRTDEEAV